MPVKIRLYSIELQVAKVYGEKHDMFKEFLFQFVISGKFLEVRLKIINSSTESSLILCIIRIVALFELKVL